MRHLRHDLWETDAFSPFPGLRTNAYLWTPPSGGNVLFYSPGNADEFDRIDQLGGVAAQYLSHQDEAGPALGLVGERFGAELRASAAELDAIAAHRVPEVRFTERTLDGHGVEVIPTPGHTPGSTSFVVTSTDGARYLFTGDTVFVGDDGGWHAGYIAGMSDADALARSLDLLATLEPDVVLSSAFGARGGPVDPARWKEYVAGAREALPVAS